MIAGTYCEAVVAEALPGCVQPVLGTHPWDLDWEGIKVEVKMTRGPSWQVPGRVERRGDKVTRRLADVYVLATHSGTDHRDGWAFYVVPTGWLDARARKSVTRRAVMAAFDQVNPSRLPDAVRAAALRHGHGTAEPGPG